MLIRCLVPIAAACLAIACSAGCGLRQWAHNGFKVGPNYCKPAVPVASEWIDYANPRIKSDAAWLATWWTTLKDPALDSLIRSAYQQNLSLRVAGARILQARYQRNIAAGNLLPQLQEALGSYTRNQLSRNVANAPPELWFSNWDAGFNVSWELDFWGRFRRAVEAADAGLDAAIENYDDVLVLLLAEVAASYVDIRTFQERLRYAHENVAAQEQSLKIAEQRLEQGAATERDVQQARTVLEQTRALVPELETGLRLANNRLCVLLGLPPSDLIAELGDSPIPSAPPEVTLGIPADLVRRRPDVRRAEREVAAQSARIGIAVSDLYPHFTLNGTFGVAAEDFSDLFDGSRSTLAGVGPAFRWDVLNYGRLVNNIRVQDARFEELAYAYQQTVLEAGREAEDGIVAFLKNQERVRSLGASSQAAARTLEITINQYRQGAVEFTAVFLAESELAQRQDQLAEAHGRTVQSLIALYRALGGGWEMRLSGPEAATIAGDASPMNQGQAEHGIDAPRPAEKTPASQQTPAPAATLPPLG